MGTTSPSAASTADYDDNVVRRRIGPWSAEGVPDLSHFEPDTTFFVRAAAGSGKTTALVSRMVALIRTGAASVDDIAAITFTRKAAGEMNARFFRELRRARRAVEGRSGEAARLDSARNNAQRAFIGTIHSFCARLLRERPLAAGLPPDFTAGLEDREERRLRDQAWRQYLQSVRSEEPERIREIPRLGLEPDDLKATFRTLCRYPELEPYTNAPNQIPDLGDAVETVRRHVDQWQDLRPTVPPKGRDRMMQALDKAEQMVRYQSVESSAERAAFLSLFDDLVRDGTVSNRYCKVTYWGDAKADAKVLRDEAVPTLVQETIRPVLRSWRAYVHARVVSFVRPAVSVYQRVRRDEGKLTFHDLLLRTRSMLRDHPEVRRIFQRQYDRILVDEFQDTDPLQAEILFYLASGDPTVTDWRACAPRPGSLFIVGDDKQSIYRFRRADKEVFDEVGGLVEEAGGEAVDLTKNFRSVGRLCEWCNRAFGRIFSDGETSDFQADYVPFDPQRVSGREGTTLRRIDVDKVRWNRGDDIAKANARDIARFIRGAVDDRVNREFYGEEGDEEAVFPGGADYSDFLILTRRKGRLSVYTEALADHDIPYTVTGSENLGESEALKAIVDLLTCALRPDDAVACVAYLKGPLVGCSDEDLYRYRRAGGHFDRMHQPVPTAVRTALDPNCRDRIVTAFDRLRRVRERFRRFRPTIALEQVVDEMGILAGAIHSSGERDVPDASVRGGAILRVLTLVQALTAQGNDWAMVLEELQRVVDGEESVDGLTMEAGHNEVVRLMNVHQAKGLEAPVVFLADPYASGGGRHEVTEHVRRETDEVVAPVVQGEEHYRRLTYAPLDWHDESTTAFRVQEEGHEAAEEDRLLYVAATRARKLLVVSTYPEKPEDGPWAPLYPYLDAAEVPALNPPSVDVSTVSTAPAPDLEATRADRNARIKSRGQPSYKIRSVTQSAKDDGDRWGGTDGFGRSFGRAVHELVEVCVRRRTSVSTISRREAVKALQEADAENADDWGQDAQRLVNDLLASALWREVVTASTVFSEYPIVRQMESAPPVVLRGVVDLLYRRAEGWGLVDVKTDKVETSDPSPLPEDHAYREQVRTYTALWHDVTGEEVTRAGLWLADSAEFVPVESI